MFTYLYQNDSALGQTELLALVMFPELRADKWKSMAVHVTASRLKERSCFPNCGLTNHVTTSRLKRKELCPKLRADKVRSMAVHVTSRLKRKELCPKLRADKVRSMAVHVTSRLKRKELCPKLRADKVRSMADRMMTSRLKIKERTPWWTQSEMVLRHILSARHVLSHACSDACTFCYQRDSH